MKVSNLKKTRSAQLDKILSFLDEIGISYTVSDDYFESFLKGIKIERGKLRISPGHLTCVGDILHEAGHLACIPAKLRSAANENISESLGEEFTCEMGVIAWSVAAAHHLGIPLAGIFHPEGYKGNAEWLLEQYTAENYLGLPLLQWMGLAASDDEVAGGKIRPFPMMLRWTRI